MHVSMHTKNIAVYFCVGSWFVRMQPARLVMSPVSQTTRKTMLSDSHLPRR